MIKSRRPRWAEHIAHMGVKRNIYIVLVKILKEREDLEDLGVDRRTILKWILK